MVLDTSCLTLSIIRYVGQSRKRSSALHLGVVAIEKGAFESFSITVTNNFFYFAVNELITDITSNISSLFSENSDFIKWEFFYWSHVFFLLGMPNHLLRSAKTVVFFLSNFYLSIYLFSVNWFAYLSFCLYLFYECTL